MARRYDSGDAKRRILAACVRLFLEKGYTNTKVAEILKEAEGKVFVAEVTQDKLEEIKQKYVVTSVLRQAEKSIVRFVTEDSSRTEAAKTVPANCEDAYMYCLLKSGVCEGGQKNA